MSALDVQEGGKHYKDKKIQPVEYIVANKMPYMDGCIVKYITRHRDKDGAKDIRKIMHYCELILELEYGPKKFVHDDEVIAEYHPTYEPT